MEYMTAKTCETCRHWGSNAPRRAVERHEVDCETKLPEHQFCDAPMAVGRPEPMGPSGRRNAQLTPPLAIVANYYDEEGGMLLTAPTFFCAMWQSSCPHGQDDPMHCPEPGCGGGYG